MILHSHQYPDRWHREAPKLFQAALNVHMTAKGVLRRPKVDQEEDVALLRRAVGELPIPSEFSEFHNCSHALFFTALMEHELSKEAGIT